MVNCSSYFFEESKRGYYQYPQDFTEDIFKSYGDSFDADSQIVAHRQPNLMYYTYMKRLSEDDSESYFGISTVINGLETTSIKSLFKLFERVFQQIVSEGEILTINSDGLIVTKDIVFSLYANKFHQLSSDIKHFIEEGADFFSPMQPVVYSSLEDDYVTIPIEERESVFRQHLMNNNKVFIIKNSKTVSAELNGLAVKIENLSGQIEYLKNRNAELESRNAVKQNYGWKALAISCLTIMIVITLGLIYCFACGLLSFNI